MITFNLKEFMGWSSNSDRVEVAITLVAKDLEIGTRFNDRVGFSMNKEQFYEFYQKMTKIKVFLEEEN